MEQSGFGRALTENNFSSTQPFKLSLGSPFCTDELYCKQIPQLFHSLAVHFLVLRKPFQVYIHSLASCLWQLLDGKVERQEGSEVTGAIVSSRCPDANFFSHEIFQQVLQMLSSSRSQAALLDCLLFVFCCIFFWLLLTPALNSVNFFRQGCPQQPAPGSALGKHPFKISLAQPTFIRSTQLVGTFWGNMPSAMQPFALLCHQGQLQPASGPQATADQ